MLVQIYGLTNSADAAAVDRLGADHLGLVLDEGIPTWDSVDEATAKAIIGEVSHSKVVALSLSRDPNRIRATADIVQPSILHLARAHVIDNDALDALRRHLVPMELMLTVPVRGPDAIPLACRLAAVADYLLLDSADPHTGVVGATGLTHDWGLSGAVVESVDVPVILAGGLGPENVAEAIRHVRPAGVDSETRTSLDADRRRKDLDKVRAFIDQARTAAALPPP